PTHSGAKADHRWAVRPSELEGVVRAIAQRVGVSNSNINVANVNYVDAVARDLQAHKGASIIIAGREAPPSVHALAHAMNAALGNVGKTVFYTDPLEVNSVDHRQSLQDLINDIDAGRVELLVILGGNPVYNTPADLKLNKDRMFKVKTRVHLSMYRDETSELCHWSLPETHYLEAWGDTRSYDGTVSIVQPLIEPLYQGHSPHEFLAVFSAQYDQKTYDIVRAFWQGHPTGNVSTAPATAASSTSSRGNQ